MRDRVHEFYHGNSDGKAGHFFRVISLHEQNFSWESLSELIPQLPRGWYELAKLPISDRVEFTRDYWLAKLPLEIGVETHFQEHLENFFAEISDIGIFATELNQGDPFEVHMVYSLTGDRGFFHGYPPISKEGLNTLSKQFGNFSFPPDYFAFLEIHDGFSKYTDTGLIKSRDMAKNYLRFQEIVSKKTIIGSDSQPIDTKSLIPFYESFGLHCYQCFFSDWYPQNEMGNVYYSAFEKEVADFINEQHLDEHLAFSSFMGWLLFYLEDLGHLS